ncbi:hypothetical protein JCM14469_18680 [Desulfatiferula olefinivorans]
MNNSILSVAGLAVIGSCQGFLDNWKKQAMATVKESLTVRFAGPQKKDLR